MIKKMKWLPLVLLLPALFLMYGCPNGDGGVPPKVTGLTIMADTEGDGVIISWNAVDYEDLVGYDVVTPDGVTHELDYDVTTYTDDTPGLTGDYEVYTVGEDESSGAVIVSSAPYVSTSNINVVGWAVTGPSGFGWNTTTGICTPYSCATGAGNEGVVDFYFYDEGTFYHFVSGDEPPYNGNKTSHILNMGQSDFVTAPTTDYYNMEDVIGANYYAINVQGDYYGKIYVVTAGTDEVTFSYEFQTIQKLRIF